ncbi:MAG TPA: hypothetical protein PKW06_13040 [Cyclobacteriaceae bacterium]|nr:hypothetical protein [Cyclobacteriaceae bacterium]
MKQTGKLIMMGVVFAALLASQGCKKKSGPGETVEDIQLAKLSKTWNATSVELDNVAQTGYDNFALTISGTAGTSLFGYKADGRPTTLSPWLSSGQWKFGASPETQIIRDPDTADELDLTYSVTDTQLQITFTFNGDGYPGRVSNVKGQWVFTFE